MVIFEVIQRPQYSVTVVLPVRTSVVEVRSWRLLSLFEIDLHSVYIHHLPCGTRRVSALEMAQHTFRVPKLDLQTILTEQNPHIDLRLDSYETSTRNFLKAVSGYTQRALTEITRRKNTHVAEKNRIGEKTQQIENETNNCKVKELELIASE